MNRKNDNFEDKNYVYYINYINYNQKKEIILLFYFFPNI